MPPLSTATQGAILALVLFAGWLLGLASHPGGRKWRERYAAERDAHAAGRRAAEQRHADDRQRLADLERENARLAAAPPVTAGPIVRPAGRSAAAPARTQRGWFDW